MFVRGIEPASNAYDYPLLIKHLLHTPLANYPNREIVHAEGQRFSYLQFRDRIGRLAHALHKSGMSPGKTVAVLDWDSHRYLECFFAIPMLGAVLHTVNIRLSPEQILYTINHAKDDYILVHEEFLPVIDAVKDRIEIQPQFILLKDNDESVDGAIEFVGEYEDLLEQGDPNFEFQDFDESTRATTFYTTGTTGNPKGVYYSHRQLVLHTLGIGTSLSIGGRHGTFTSEDVYMPITPMFHVHAWGMPYLATLLGVKQIYPGRYIPERLVQLIEREEVTLSHCVPTILHMLLQAQQSLNTDLSGWKVIIGGSALPQGLAQQAIDLGVDIFGGYGLSETCPVLTLAKLDREFLNESTDEQLSLRCKAGRSIAMVDIKTVDDHGNELPRDGKTTGEVVVRSPWLTQGYYKEPERSDELWHSGYLHTGDIGHIDEHGYLKVTDRLKDVIKSGGEWISSLQLEDIVSQLSEVSEAAAIGIPDKKWGERPVVLAVIVEGQHISEDAIKDHIKKYAEDGTISKWAIPDQVHLVEAIEKTSVGKIDKKLLRSKYVVDSL